MEKYLVYKATGGITHMLYGLSFAISIAKKQKRVLVIDTVTGYENLKDKFSKFFYISLKNLVYSEDFNIIPKTYNYNNFNLNQIKNLPAQSPQKNKTHYLKNQIISNYKYIKKKKKKGCWYMVEQVLIYKKEYIF